MRGFYILFLIAVCLFFGKLFFGFSCFLVGSASMEPSYPVHSLVVVRQVPLQKIAVGDVIAFRSDALGGGLALHRVVRITAEGIFTQGDASRHEDKMPVTEQNYEGKMVFAVTFFGRWYKAVQTTGGFFLCLVLPAAGIGVLCWLLIRKKKS